MSTQLNPSRARSSPQIHEHTAQSITSTQLSIIPWAPKPNHKSMSPPDPIHHNMRHPTGSPSPQDSMVSTKPDLRQDSSKYRTPTDYSSRLQKVYILKPENNNEILANLLQQVYKSRCWFLLGYGYEISLVRSTNPLPDFPQRIHSRILHIESIPGFSKTNPLPDSPCDTQHNESQSIQYNLWHRSVIYHVISNNYHVNFHLYSNANFSKQQ